MFPDYLSISYDYDYLNNLKVSLNTDAHTINLLSYVTIYLIWVCSYSSGLCMPISIMHVNLHFGLIRTHIKHM